MVGQSRYYGKGVNNFVGAGMRARAAGLTTACYR